MRSRAGTVTTVDGNRFRSLTEARFAVFLSALGVRWKHEPGILKVGEYPDGRAMWYCPDFVLPEWGIHVEVKPSPQAISLDEMEKPVALAHWPMPVLVWWFDECRGMFFGGPDSICFADLWRCRANHVSLEVSPIQDDEGWVWGSPRRIGCDCDDATNDSILRAHDIALAWRPPDRLQLGLGL